jgi:hypothetical protein
LSSQASMLLKTRVNTGAVAACMDIVMEVPVEKFRLNQKSVAEAWDFHHQKMLMVGRLQPGVSTAGASPRSDAS